MPPGLENEIAASTPVSPPRPLLGLPAERRLRKAADFLTLRARGRRVNAGFLSATLRPNGLGHARLGLAIAVRIAGNAVERNRLRRVIRESFRLLQTELPAIDVVVGARPQVRDATNPALRATLVDLWDKVMAACAASRSS